MPSNETLGPRIVTLDTPGSQHIVLLKDGKQMGLVFWANLDTKEYRRIATFMDLLDGPWENKTLDVANHGNARIVRPRHYEGVSKIRFSTLHQLDAEGYDLEYLLPKDGEYTIDQYPVVDYLSTFPVNADLSANIRTTALMVEGTFDEVLLGSNAPDEVLALYPDLPVRQPKPVGGGF